MASALVYAVVAGLSLMLLGTVPAEADVNCGDIITTDTVLLEDLACDEDDLPRLTSALTVVGPARLDLGGHTVRCLDAGPCIVLEGGRAQLRSGRVSTDMRTAVLLGGDGRHTVRQVIASSGEQDGFAITSDHNRLWENIDTSSDGAGFRVSGAHNLLIGNTGTGCLGLGPCFLVAGARNILTDNSALPVESEEGGFEITGERNHLIHNSVMLSRFPLQVSVPYGIRLRASAAFTRVVSNTVSDSDVGIEVGSDSNMIVGNQVHENGIGISVLAGAEINRIVGNDATGNGTLDLVDGNEDCDDNVWRANRFDTANQYCIRPRHIAGDLK